MPATNTERAHRILDAAADLLVRWGYPRVSIDEIAKKAGVGKGTVYLHWRSRDDLFRAVFLREGVAVTRRAAARIAADPRELLPHRYLAELFGETMTSPLLHAAYTRDADLLGRLADGPAGESLRSAKLSGAGEYFGLLAEHGLLRDDIDVDEFTYAIGAVILGFLLVDPYLPDTAPQDIDRKKAIVADTIHRAFEPEEEPDLRRLTELAPKLSSVLTTLADEYQSLLTESN